MLFVVGKDGTKHGYLTVTPHFEEAEGTQQVGYQTCTDVEMLFIT